MTKKIALVLFVAALAVSGCGGGTDPSTDTAPTPETAATTSKTGEPNTGETSRCVDAAASPWVGDYPAMTILDVLATGYTDGTVDLGAIEPVLGVVVESAETAPVGGGHPWIIAMLFAQNGAEQVGVWGSTEDADGGGLGSGLWLSIDDVAQSATIWPTPDFVSTSTDGVAEALACLRGQRWG